MAGPSDAPLMLGVSGLRGIVGQRLTPEVAVRYAGAFAAWLRASMMGGAGRPRVVVGRDGRAGGHAIHHAAIAGLCAGGCDVIDLGVAMTPTIGHAVDWHGAAGGLVVTASHNPQDWNGLKLLAGWTDGDPVRPVLHPDGRFVRPSHTVQARAAAPDVRTAEQIIARYRQGAAPAVAWDAVGEVNGASGTLGHVQAVIGGIRSLDQTRAMRARVVVDSVNASGEFGSRALLDQLGCERTHLGNEATGLFPHPPEPTRENLTGLGGAIREHRAAIGFAQDPDADRLAIIDERGEYIGEEYTLVLAAIALLESAGLAAEPARPGREGRGATSAGRDRVICVNLSTSRMIDDVAAQYGARVVRTAVGEANVVEAMKRETAAGRDVILGGEGNGGVIWPEVTYVRDSLSAMALVLALMARTGKTVSQLVAEIPAYAIEKRKVDLARKEDAVPAVEKLAAAYKGRRLDRQDGIRIDFDDQRAWLHVRASNTEPIMRLIAEAPSAEAARALLNEAAKVIAG